MPRVITPTNVKWIVIKHGVEYPAGPGRNVRCVECAHEIPVPTQPMDWEGGKLALLFMCENCGCQFVGVIQE